MSSAASEQLLSLVGHGEAPGRLDFMGGVADYSGSMVLEMPIRSARQPSLPPATATATATATTHRCQPTEPPHCAAPHIPLTAHLSHTIAYRTTVALTRCRAPCAVCGCCVLAGCLAG